MTPTEVAAKLQHFNDSRRGHHDDTAQPDTREIGEAIDAAIAMIERLEAMEKDIALKERIIDSLGSELNAVSNERDALRAKIEAMEQQKPAGTLHDDGCFVWSTPRPYDSNYAGWKMKLYLAPGAQPAPSIRPAVLSPVINWLRNGCDPMEAADELEVLASLGAEPCP